MNNPGSYHGTEVISSELKSRLAVEAIQGAQIISQFGPVLNQWGIRALGMTHYEGKLERRKLAPVLGLLTGAFAFITIYTDDLQYSSRNNPDIAEVVSAVLAAIAFGILMYSIACLIGMMKDSIKRRRNSS